MKIAIFHGTGGSPSGNWFPWLKYELERMGVTVFAPTLPTPEGQNLDNWLAAVKQQIPDLNKVDIFIGHSCGATFIPHLITRENLAPSQCVMVSAFWGTLGVPDYDTLNQTFFLDNALCRKAKKTGAEFTQFHGTNDPYVPLAQANKIAALLGAELHLMPEAGHLNAEFGYTTFPEILRVLNV